MTGQRIITYAEAIREAISQEMSRDPSVILYGLDVDDHKSIYGTTRGLAQKFGSKRVFGTPLSEDALTGFGIGAALAGLRPIHVHIRMDFLMLAMNQLVNVASKYRYTYGGACAVPMVVRAIIGKSWGQGAQHSQGLYPLLMHIPGLKIVAPTTPYDAKGCMVQSIRDDNPVIFIEHRMLHSMSGHVPENLYSVNFGNARILAAGDDITIVGISNMANEACKASKILNTVGINAEVIDPVTLYPFDMKSIIKSVDKTGKLIVIDNSWTTCGAGSEIIARITEHFDGRKAFKIKRLGYEQVTCPTTKPLEDIFYPNAERIATCAYAMVKGRNKKIKLPTRNLINSEQVFKGPF